MKAVLMAGGKGTRIASVISDIPKPMIPIEGMPVLEREIANLREQGIKEIIITVSHLGHVIMDYFGNGNKISPVTGKPFGVAIEYFYEEEPLGNAGALFKLQDKLLDNVNEDSFLLLNADAIYDVDFQRMIRFHRDKHASVTIFTHPNSHPFDSGLIVADQEGRVSKWLTKEEIRPTYYKNRVNAGLHIISVRVLSDFRKKYEGKRFPNKVDLDRMVLQPLVNKEMYAYDSSEYVKDMGTPERYEMVCRDFRKGIIKARNLRYKQKAVFLDRDGTINKYVGFLTNPEQFELLPGVAEAIKAINKSGYLCIVVTNQPVIARGEVTYEQLECIHNKMETLLGEKGAYVDAIYFCPHHPDRGFEGEVKELKIDCGCRKPKPGMILRAARDYNIDLSNSYVVGDSESDIIAGKLAGCKTILVSNQSDIHIGQDYMVSCLENILRLYLLANH